MNDQLKLTLTLENKDQREIVIPIGHDLEDFSEAMMFKMDELLHDIMSVKLFHLPLSDLDEGQKETVLKAVDNLNN